MTCADCGGPTIFEDGYCGFCRFKPGNTVWPPKQPKPEPTFCGNSSTPSSATSP